MPRRLPTALVRLRVAQFVAILLLVFGPVQNVAAVQSFTNDCSSGCPCEAEASDDPCSDHDTDDAGADHAPAYDCGDDCDDCDCERGIGSAVAPPVTDSSARATPHARAAPVRGAAPEGDRPDIFIPPRR